MDRSRSSIIWIQDIWRKRCNFCSYFSSYCLGAISACHFASDTDCGCLGLWNTIRVAQQKYLRAWRIGVKRFLPISCLQVPTRFLFLWPPQLVDYHKESLPPAVVVWISLSHRSCLLGLQQQRAVDNDDHVLAQVILPLLKLDWSVLSSTVVWFLLLHILQTEELTLTRAHGPMRW